MVEPPKDGRAARTITAKCTQPRNAEQHLYSVCEIVSKYGRTRTLSLVGDLENGVNLCRTISLPAAFFCFATSVLSAPKPTFSPRILHNYPFTSATADINNAGRREDLI